MKEGITLILIIVLIVVGACVFATESCNAKTIGFDDHSFSIFTGCMVKHGDKWLPLENIRGFGDEP